MERAERMVLCALAVLVTALMGARAVTCSIAGQPQPHALPVITANTTDSSSSSGSSGSSSFSSSSSSSPRLCSAAPARRARSYPHLQGDTRRRKLYSFQSLFLRIDGSGRVSGTRSRHDVHTVLEITSVDVGVVAIRSLTTGYYLTMNRRGEVFGEREYSVNCRLKERIEENGYNTYASAQWRKRHRAMFISLNTNGKPLRGTKTHRRNTNTHFLPISV
ncbi:fibroblast growth factor 10b [Neoarius graeffei]|uniref:fibroblast growth factor 10b n=1 Tax=Neoarius graeffei TaxID=443677 RepID=UPI00298D3FB6|nr:fibroblast growth factor 10b [Neoarius graeffei]